MRLSSIYQNTCLMSANYCICVTCADSLSRLHCLIRFATGYFTVESLLEFKDACTLTLTFAMHICIKCIFVLNFSSTFFFYRVFVKHATVFLYKRYTLITLYLYLGCFLAIIYC